MFRLPIEKAGAAEAVAGGVADDPPCDVKRAPAALPPTTAAIAIHLPVWEPAPLTDAVPGFSSAMY
jgi:hypothetical protein